MSARTKTTRMTVDIPVAQHRALRILSARRGQSISDMIRALVAGLVGSKHTRNTSVKENGGQGNA